MCKCRRPAIAGRSTRTEALFHFSPFSWVGLGVADQTQSLDVGDMRADPLLEAFVIAMSPAHSARHQQRLSHVDQIGGELCLVPYSVDDQPMVLVA